jgi:ATP-dependent DNA helicase RecG
VRTGVTAQISREAEVSALGRALAVERRARYIDFRGKRTTFSTFMRITADRLCKRFPSDSRWSTIRGLFTHYANLDVASRISIVRRTEELLFVPETPEKEPEPVFVNPAPKKPPAPARPPQDPATVDIKYVKGVGPKIAELFHKLGINTAGDLIRHYPRHHLDFQNRMLIRELEPGQEVTVFGTIRSVNAFQSRNRNVSIMTIVIGDGTGSVSRTSICWKDTNRSFRKAHKCWLPALSSVTATPIVCN